MLAIRNMAVAALALTQVTSVKSQSNSTLLSSITNSLTITPQPQRYLRGTLNQAAADLRSVDFCNLNIIDLNCQQLKNATKEAVAQNTTLPFVLGNGTCNFINEELAKPGENVQLLACFGPLTTTNENCKTVLGGYLAGQLDTEKCSEVCNGSPTSAPTSAPTGPQTLGATVRRNPN